MLARAAAARAGVRRAVLTHALPRPHVRRVSGWRLLEAVALPDIAATGRVLVHRTGATMCHIDAPGDPQLTFGAVVRTPVSDDTGVAHVCEHMTLCGSREFPVREVLTEMGKRSIASDMNAGTDADMTIFHATTHNATDFTNLVRVFTDAILFPLLKDEDFAQEAHRAEPSGASTWRRYCSAPA